MCSSSWPEQRGDRTVVRLADRESGLSARTIARRLSSVSGLYAYLVARGDTPVRVSPVPRGLMTRRQGRSDAITHRAAGAGAPDAAESVVADGGRRLVHALRTRRDRAMVVACSWPGFAGARCWACGSATSGG